jgi:hypothetical protein
MFTGVVMIFLGVSIIALSALEQQKIPLFDWAYTTVFVLNGIHHIAAGRGYYISRSN